MGNGVIRRRAKVLLWGLLPALLLLSAVVSGSDRLLPLQHVADGHEHAAMPAPTGSTAETRAGQAVQLRTSLERLLGQHVLLSARLVRLRVTGDEAYIQAAVNSLSRNTRDLSDLITQVYGP